MNGKVRKVSDTTLMVSTNTRTKYFSVDKMVDIYWDPYPEIKVIVGKPIVALKPSILNRNNMRA